MFLRKICAAHATMKMNEAFPKMREGFMLQFVALCEDRVFGGIDRLKMDFRRGWTWDRPLGIMAACVFSRYTCRKIYIKSYARHHAKGKLYPSCLLQLAANYHTVSFPSQ